MLAINTIVVFVSLWLLPITDGQINPTNLAFYLPLITLIVMLYDRCRPVSTARVAARAC